MHTWGVGKKVKWLQSTETNTPMLPLGISNTTTAWPHILWYLADRGKTEVPCISPSEFRKKLRAEHQGTIPRGG